MAHISEEEKLRRRESNACVLGTHAMEGMFPDATTLSLMDRYAEGELTREQLSSAIDRNVQEMLAGKRAETAREFVAQAEHSIA
jgi:hypothetical protein